MAPIIYDHFVHAFPNSHMSKKQLLLHIAVYLVGSFSFYTYIVKCQLGRTLMKYSSEKVITHIMVLSLSFSLAASTNRVFVFIHLALRFKLWCPS